MLSLELFAAETTSFQVRTLLFERLVTLSEEVEVIWANSEKK